MLERVRNLPGVVAAAIAEDVLLGEVAARPRMVTVEGAAGAAATGIRLPLSLDAVTPDFFRATGVTLQAGRFFGDEDGADSLRVVIVNETLARRLWPGENPVGRRLRSGEPDSTAPWATVVGVVADVRRQGPDRAPIAQTFWPLTQRPSRGGALVVRTSVEPSTLAAAVRVATMEVNRSVSVRQATTLRQQLDAQLAGREFNLGLLAVFAMVALALAGVGIFGLMSYAVTQRRQELGIRLALGAQPRGVRAAQSRRSALRGQRR